MSAVAHRTLARFQPCQTPGLLHRLQLGTVSVNARTADEVSGRFPRRPPANAGWRVGPLQRNLNQGLGNALASELRLSRSALDLEDVYICLSGPLEGHFL